MFPAARSEALSPASSPRAARRSPDEPEVHLPLFVLADGHRRRGVEERLEQAGAVGVETAQARAVDRRDAVLAGAPAADHVAAVLVGPPAQTAGRLHRPPRTIDGKEDDRLVAHGSAFLVAARTGEGAAAFGEREEDALGSLRGEFTRRVGDVARAEEDAFEKPACPRRVSQDRPQ